MLTPNGFGKKTNLFGNTQILKKNALGSKNPKVIRFEYK
jgi:hypothetical protein